MALILIVDDSPTEQHVISKSLEDHGYETTVASDGLEALEKAEREQPEMILMDVVMPGMNGFQATRKLTRNPSTSSIPVVMLSTKGQESDRVWGLRQGAVKYLVKPVDANDLVKVVEDVVA